MPVVYEWDVEELEEHPNTGNGFDPDIANHHFVNSYMDARSMLEGLEREGLSGRIVLVRDKYTEDEGLIDRAWAYITNGELPVYFEYGADEISAIPVPKKYHIEVSRW